MRINRKFHQTTIVLFLTFAFFVSTANAQWRKQTAETKASLRGLSVVSDQIIWASGTGGTFLKTADGGKTWTVGTVPGAEKLDFRDVEAFDAETAYLLSIGAGETSRIYKTVDGGKNWKLLLQNKNPKAFFDAFAFWNARNGIFMSDPVDGKFLLFVTDDGGETWRNLRSHGNDSMPLAKEGEAAFAASGTCLITQGAQNVFLVSGGTDARVFRSKSRGLLDWSVSNTPITKGTAGSGIFSIAMYDAKRGVIVGGNYEKPNETGDNLAFTEDGGRTWRAAKGLNGYRSGVAYVNEKTLIAVGSSGSDVSKDGGKTWAEIDKENYNAVQTKGENAIWAVGANGLIANFRMR